TPGATQFGSAASRANSTSRSRSLPVMPSSASTPAVSASDGVSWPVSHRDTCELPRQASSPSRRVDSCCASRAWRSSAPSWRALGVSALLTMQQTLAHLAPPRHSLDRGIAALLHGAHYCVMEHTQPAATISILLSHQETA